MPTLQQMFDSFDPNAVARSRAGKDFISGTFGEHYNFYIKGVMNSMLTSALPFVKPRTMTENDVSGEYLEALRLVIDKTHPDLQVGQAAPLTYNDVMRVLGGESIFKQDGPPQIRTVGERIRTSLGDFGVRRTPTGLEVFDTYDYEPVHQGGLFSHLEEAQSDYSKEGFYAAARTMGGYFMPENPDGSSREGALKVLIKIPEEPMVVNIDYDDDPPEGAEDFVFRGPMTNLRKSLWDRFTSLIITPAEADELDLDYVRGLAKTKVISPDQAIGIAETGNVLTGGLDKFEAEVMHGTEVPSALDAVSPFGSSKN